MSKKKPTQREQLAEHMHVIWAAYMKHFFKRCTRLPNNDFAIPQAYYHNVHVLCDTDYWDMPDEQKGYDLDEADKILVLLGLADETTTDE